MKYRKLGKSNLEVSVIGQGTWGLGNDFFGEVNENLGVKAIQTAIDAGVNLIDTAHAYGGHCESEIAVGKAVAGRRDKVILATKCGLHRIYGAYVRGLAPSVIRCELEDSLKNLRTDYIDIYQLHWPDYNAGIEGALKELLKMKWEGKIREIGVSNFSVNEIQKSIDIADIACVQPQLNLFNRDNLNNGIIPFCKDNELGILSYGTLGGGILTDKKDIPTPSSKEKRGSFYHFYNEPIWSKCQEMLGILREIGSGHKAAVSEVAINWALVQPGVTCTLIGALKPNKVLENIKAVQWELTTDELKIIEENYKRIFSVISCNER